MTAITLTTAGKNLWRDGAKGNNNPKITYVALGSSNTTPTAGDTKLGNETFRKRVTSYISGSNGEFKADVYIAPGEAVGMNIQEIGFFGGSTASSAKDSGVLVAHGLYVHNPKTNTESLQLELDETFT